MTLGSCFLFFSLYDNDVDRYHRNSLWLVKVGAEYPSTALVVVAWAGRGGAG